MEYSRRDPKTKTLKTRLRSLMLLKAKPSAVVNHEQMLLLTKQIDAHRVKNSSKHCQLSLDHEPTPESNVG